MGLHNKSAFVNPLEEIGLTNRHSEDLGKYYIPPAETKNYPLCTSFKCTGENNRACFVRKENIDRGQQHCPDCRSGLVWVKYDKWKKYPLLRSVK